MPIAHTCQERHLYLYMCPNLHQQQFLSLSINMYHLVSSDRWKRLQDLLESRNMDIASIWTNLSCKSVCLSCSTAEAQHRALWRHHRLASGNKPLAWSMEHRQLSYICTIVRKIIRSKKRKEWGPAFKELGLPCLHLPDSPKFLVRQCVRTLSQSTTINTMQVLSEHEADYYGQSSSQIRANDAFLVGQNQETLTVSHSLSQVVSRLNLSLNCT